MTLFRIVFSLAAALLLAGCALVRIQGSGNMTTETRAVSDFENVSVCCGMRLFLTQGEPEQLTLEAEDNVIPEIETIVSDKTLTVRFRQQFGALSYILSGPVTIRLQMPTIRNVTLSGGSQIETEQIAGEQATLEFSGASGGEIGELLVDDVTISISGGGKVNVGTITGEMLNVNMSGGSKVTIATGSVTEQHVTGGGGSDYDAAAVQSQVATATISGGGRAEVAVSESLHAEASGGSRVEYSGNPSVTQNTSGGSEVRSVSR